MITPSTTPVKTHDGHISLNVYKKGLKHSSVMAVCTFIRSILAFVPTILIAKKIGLGNITDAYLMAFSINQIIIKFLRVGTLPKVFTMVLSQDFVGSRKKTEENMSNLFNIFLVFSILVMFFVYFIAPLLVNIIAKGFDADKKILTINIVRLLAPLFFYQIMVSLCDSIFKLSSEFSRWAILSVVSPLIIFLFVVLSISKIGIYSMVYGTLAGCFLHILLLVYYIYVKFNFSYRFKLDFKQKMVKEIPVLLYPYYLSSVPVQFMLGIQSFLVSLLAPGIASVYFYALRIQDYVEEYTINIFSEMAFPFFIKKVALSSLDAIKKFYAQLICFPNYAFLPALIILAVFGNQIVYILFRSKFTDPYIISLLGGAFSYLMVFFLLEPSNNMQFNVILAMKKTGWVNLVNVLRTALVIVLSVVLFKYFKFWGVIFSYSATYLQGFLINQWYLRRKYAFENIFANPRFIKIIFLNILLALFCFYLNYNITHNFHLTNIYQNIMVAATACSLSILFYGLISYLFKCEELKILFSLVRRDKFVHGYAE